MGKALVKPSKDIPPILEREFRDLSKYIVEITGVKLVTGKENLLESRLSRRLGQLGLNSWREYISYLESGIDENEKQVLINLITTNKTHFFRELPHFDYLKKEYIPERFKDFHDKEKTVFIWSAASSRGHEAYSMAMLLDDEICKRSLQHNLNYKILGTDINTNVINHSQRGVYPGIEVEGEVPTEMVQRYFLKGEGSNAGKYLISKNLASNIKFRYHNLVDPHSMLNVEFDVILVRNVLIYFDRKTIDIVIKKVCAHLKSGGLLILGHSEHLESVPKELTYMGSSIYKKT